MIFLVYVLLFTVYAILFSDDMPNMSFSDLLTYPKGVAEVILSCEYCVYVLQYGKVHNQHFDACYAIVNVY